ncbi:MAG: hypothetical protein IJH12_05445 [Clostridia bacterium]|nr:hypothetical protein [Clostridia bacterium]
MNFKVFIHYVVVAFKMLQRENKKQGKIMTAKQLADMLWFAYRTYEDDYVKKKSEKILNPLENRKMIKIFILLMLGCMLFGITRLAIKIIRLYKQKYKYPKYYRMSLLTMLKEIIVSNIEQMKNGLY